MGKDGKRQGCRHPVTALRIGIIGGAGAFARSLERIAAAAGHTVVAVPSLAEGQSLKPLPDMFVAEIPDDGGDVIETVIRLHRGRETRQLPVVAVSPSPELEDELPPVLDFIVKPVDPARLREDIEIVARNPGKAVRPAAEQLSEADFRRFRDYLITRSGLRFEQRNVKFLTRGIRTRMQVLHIDSYRAYFDYLSLYHESRQEMQKLLQLLTVGETYFFRYRPHFDVLSRLIRKQLGTGGGRLRIWSAGCSTGEEPYSIAMSIMDACPDWREKEIEVLATDINRSSLRKALEGSYRPWVMRATDQRHMQRYFRKTTDGFRIEDEVKELVKFFHLNLKSSSYPDPHTGLADLDAIFCRNVLIYFDMEAIRGVVEKLAAALRPGGYLFLGHAETLSFLSTQFERHTFAGGFYYRKRSGTPQLAKRERRAPAERKPAAPVPKRAASPVRAIPVEEPAPHPETLFRQAQGLFESEDYSAAARTLDRLATLSPDHVGALVLRGFILANTGRLEESLAQCERALKLDDLCADAYFLKGLVLELVDQQERAVKEYRKAILLDMEFLMPHYYLGRLLLRMGRQRDGMREMRTCARFLERPVEERMIPYGGGMTREGLLLQLRRELAAADASDRTGERNPA